MAGERAPWDGTTERRGEVRGNVPPHDHPNLYQKIESIESKLDEHIGEIHGWRSMLHKAFLKDDDGEPDLLGHRKDHSDKKASAQTRGKYFSSAFEKVIGVVAIAATAWLGSAIFNHFVSQVAK